MSLFSNRAELLFSRRAKLLGLFADILDYPAPGLASKAAECAALIRAAQPKAAALLESFRHYAEENTLGKLQEVFSGFFDLNSVCHPYVGYQLFGENYKRSIFLIGLRKSYRAEGFEADASEMADRLSIVLRFAAQSKGGEEIDDLLSLALLPALARMTTKPETETHHHDGPADVDGDTGIERAKLDDREMRKQLKAQSQARIEERNLLNGRSQGDERKQLKGQSQGDQLGAGFLLALSEDLDGEAVEKREHPYHQALDALRLVLHEGLTKKSPDRSAEQERVRTWTQERFKLADDEAVMVSELPCSDPGCPPVETHVVFWTQAGRQHFKVFKPLAEVAADDLLDWRA
jgi:nitrate reductase molybdenum cofactor assembly chaperone NarJ/NarW